ncbi:MAG: hypothetical protein KGK05_12070 [Xanthomonadaceae bacterium]|nr:hypothetical protein [Xanthomonadaceae bacterium]
MDAVGKLERATRQRVIALFCDALGYRYLGDWTERENGNVEESLLQWRDLRARLNRLPIDGVHCKAAR